MQNERELKIEQINKRLNELQYAAMACAQAGQPVPEEQQKEYAELERALKELAK